MALVLNDVEKSTLQLIKDVAISGYTLSSESYVEFSFKPGTICFLKQFIGTMFTYAYLLVVSTIYYHTLH